MKGRVGGNIRGDKEQVFLGGAAQRGVWSDEGGDDDGSVPWFYRWSFFSFFSCLSVSRPPSIRIKLWAYREEQCGAGGRWRSSSWCSKGG